MPPERVLKILFMKKHSHKVKGRNKTFSEIKLVTKMWHKKCKL